MWWFISLLVLVVWFIYYDVQLKKKRREFVQRFRFDSSIRQRVATKYPHLTPPQIEQVLAGLRDYFQVVVAARGSGLVSMPSQAVDEAWHAFILSTKAYASFCQRAFGRFLHHHPAETMTSPTQATQGIKRVWNLACLQENIDAAKPQRLPRLFALDSELNIPHGFVYSLACMAANAPANSFCASDIGSGCGSSSSDSGDGGGCGGGD